jgi:hypothetical protein
MPLIDLTLPSTDSDEDDRSGGRRAALLQTITKQAAVEKPLLEPAVINEDAESQRQALQPSVPKQISLISRNKVWVVHPKRYDLKYPRERGQPPGQPHDEDAAFRARRRRSPSWQGPTPSSPPTKTISPTPGEYIPGPDNTALTLSRALQTEVQGASSSRELSRPHTRSTTAAANFRESAGKQGSGVDC